MAIDLTPMLHDDDDSTASTTPCTPRISLDCSECKRSVIYCHIGDGVLAGYVNPDAPRWRCSSCSGVSHA